ncbi:uncharacterized protein Z518_09863 [Rhinocladiella mackenziei CBS 650.93]|uniref:Velvet complex subunit laeA n=1 Tax=Rhinocladiella mackenziei CBS 650.93 TaxID=1442369 RepID=A0A0D2GR48_9EURO|nr:uncharacterized protein Z518_09863 [Rhinocladiella mackenziei CBS 650.93]KIX00798.1 hypothetical protein Z518_09863 [Rhinocladiella mackenziei CBS 650.93]
MASMPEIPIPGRTTEHKYGREYGTFRRGQYLFPHDEKERDRLDVMHTMIKVARPMGMRYTHCPTNALSARPGPLGQRPRVLDLGCGTGIWMIEMASSFPAAEFVGVDIHNMGPPTLLPNIGIRAPWDYEGPWALGEKSWDIIRLQMGLGSVSDWPGLYSKILRHLTPGTGWFESIEIDFQPRCDDNTLRPGKLTEWWDSYIKGTYEAMNRRLAYDPGTGDLLRVIGFKDIHHAVYRIPLNDAWPEDKAEKRAALWWHVAMSPGHATTGGYGLEAMSLAALCGLNNWPVDHVKRLCNEALAQAADPNVHAYNNLHIWWARAGGEDEKGDGLASGSGQSALS